MMNAYEWGLKHESCKEALEWRKSLGPEATQASAWQKCQRGDWLFWQLEHGLSRAKRRALRPTIDKLVERIVARAIRRALKFIRGNREPWVTEYRAWARKWLSGEDRSRATAHAAAHAADDVAWAAADDVEWEAAAHAADAAWAAADAAGVAWADVAWAAADAAEVAWAAAEDAAWAAADAAWAAAKERERLAQTREIRRVIPVWPGKT